MQTRYIPVQVPSNPDCRLLEMKGMHYRHAVQIGEDEFADQMTISYSVLSEPVSCLDIDFSNVGIVRILDEVFLNSEEMEDERRGIAPGGFAYRLENSRWATDYPLFHEICPKAAHYRFITATACIDVLSTAAPTFNTDAAGYAIE